MRKMVALGVVAGVVAVLAAPPAARPGAPGAGPRGSDFATLAADTPPPLGVALTGSARLARRFQLDRRLPLTWTATDPESGILNYQLGYRVAPMGRALGPRRVSVTTVATGTTFSMRPGSAYCFNVRARNGNALDASSAERCTALPLSAASMTPTGRWSNGRKAGYFLGRFRSATTRGASLTRRGVSARRLVIVAARGPGMGTVAVYLGGRRLRTVRLASRTVRRRQVVPVVLFASTRRGTVRIVITSSHRPVVIEGLGASSRQVSC